MAEGIYDSTTIEVLCDGCGHNFIETLGVLRFSPEVKCPTCREPLAISGKLAETMAQMDAAWVRFQSDLKKVGA